jgi:hypothetical protein
MSNKIGYSLLLAAIVFLVAATGIGAGGCSSAEEQEYSRIASIPERQAFQEAVRDLRAQGASIKFGVRPPYRGGRPQGVMLEDNITAVNPTWRQLVDFLEADLTDVHSYIPLAYTCAEFAEALHNAAEKAGIRCAFVGVDFGGDTLKHALDAFYTLDMGWVFINSMGTELSQSTLLNNSSSSDTQDTKLFEGWSGDSMAFLKIGSELGFVHISIIDSSADSSDYTFFKGWKSRKQAFKTALEQYNRDVQSYNDWIRGRVFYRGTPDAIRAESWGKELDERKSALERDSVALGPDYNPMGVVKAIDIYF